MSSTQRASQDTSWAHSVAGAAAGSAAVLLLHPFDVIKTRLQVQDGRQSVLTTYQGLRHAARTMYQQEGLRSFYKGLTPAWLGSGVAWSAYFTLYEGVKAWHMRWLGVQQLTPIWHTVSAAEAGAMVCLLTNPIWLIKTRLQLQQQPRTPVPPPSPASAHSAVAGPHRPAHAAAPLASPSQAATPPHAVPASAAACQSRPGATPSQSMPASAAPSQPGSAAAHASSHPTHPSPAAASPSSNTRSTSVSGASPHASQPNQSQPPCQPHPRHSPATLQSTSSSSSPHAPPMQHHAGVPARATPPSAYQPAHTPPALRAGPGLPPGAAPVPRLPLSPASLAAVSTAPVQQRQYRGLLDAVLSIAREEGVRGFYKGLAPSLLLQTSHGAIQFTVYEELKRQAILWNAASRASHVSRPAASSTTSHMSLDAPTSTAGSAGIRPSDHTGEETSTAPGKAAQGTVSFSTRANAADGGAAAAGTLRDRQQVGQGEQQQQASLQGSAVGGGPIAPTSLQTSLAAAASKLAASITTYPTQVIRSRLQQRTEGDRPPLYQGTWDAVRRTWRHEGLQGFYKGLGPALIRVLPQSAVTLLVYENVLVLMRPVAGLSVGGMPASQ